jgi:hypothetical protein
LNSKKYFLSKDLKKVPKKGILRKAIPKKISKKRDNKGESSSSDSRSEKADDKKSEEKPVSPRKFIRYNKEFFAVTNVLTMVGIQVKDPNDYLEKIITTLDRAHEDEGPYQVLIAQNLEFLKRFAEQIKRPKFFSSVRYPDSRPPKNHHKNESKFLFGMNLNQDGMTSSNNVQNLNRNRMFNQAPLTIVNGQVVPQPFPNTPGNQQGLPSENLGNPSPADPAFDKNLQLQNNAINNLIINQNIDKNKHFLYKQQVPPIVSPLNLKNYSMSVGDPMAGGKQYRACGTTRLMGVTVGIYAISYMTRRLWERPPQICINISAGKIFGWLMETIVS